MIDLITKVDFMGKEFKFMLGGEMKEMYQTLFGGILSIIQAIGFLILLWYYGKDIYERQSPTVIISDSVIDYYPKVTVNSNMFKFAFRVEDYYGNTIDDPSIFYYDFLFESFVDSGNGTFYREKRYNITTEPCTTKHFEKDTLDLLHIDHYRCIENNYTFGGNWGTTFVMTPQFFVRRCDNETERKYNVTCKTDKEVVDKYPMMWLNTYHQKNLMNSSRYENAIEPFYIYTEKQLDLTNPPNVLKYIYIYSSAELITDTGLFFSDYSQREFLEFEGKDANILPYDEELGKYVASMEFQVSRSFRTYARVYIRLSDALANVGGFMSLVTTVINVLFSFYIDNSYLKFLQERLVKVNKEIKDDLPNIENIQNIEINLAEKTNNKENQIYDYNHVNNMNISKDIKNDSSNEILNKPSPSLSPISNPNPAKTQAFFKNINKKDIVINKEINEVIEYKNHKLENVHISTPERMYFTYCCFNGNSKKEEKNYKYKLFTAVNKSIEKRTEIFEFIKIIDQINLILKILLNKNQSFMLQNRELHRVIDTKILSDDDEKTLIEARDLERKKDLIDYLSKRKNENSLSATDILLFKYLESELKDEINSEIKIE